MSVKTTYYPKGQISVKAKLFPVETNQHADFDFANIDIIDDDLAEIELTIHDYEQLKSFMEQIMEAVPQLEAQWYRILKERGELPAEVTS